MEILDTSGFTAVRASDGGEAVELFEKSQPYEFDIILMDVQMLCETAMRRQSSSAG